MADLVMAAVFLGMPTALAFGGLLRMSLRRNGRNRHARRHRALRRM